jgi:hypothetical protein
MAEADRVDNCRKACIAAGVNVITSLEGGSAEAIFCKEWYELIVNAEISLYYWRFATRTQNIKNSLLADVPEDRFSAAYQAPNDVVSVDTVMIGGTSIEYERVGDRIHCDAATTDDLIIKYRYRADESVWLPYFKLLVVYRLATMLSFSISRKEEVAASMKALADEHWRRSKTQDAQGQTNQKVNLSKLKRVRQGGRLSRDWRNR